MNEADILKAIGEITRLRIVRLLLKTGEESCGCELVDSLLIPQYNLTKHVDILIRVGLVASRKEGRWVYYSSCSNTTAFCESLCQSILKIKDKMYSDDLERFKKRLRIRKEGKCLLGIQNRNLI